MYNFRIPKKIFRLSETEVKRLLVWYANQPEEIQVEAMKLSSDLFFQWRNKYPTGKNEVRFGTFVLALKKMRHFDHIITEKNPNHDLKKIRKVTEMKMDRFLARKKAERKRKKPSKKRDKILMYSDEIKMLRDKGFSFRMIAEFLKVNRRFSVHYTYIEKLWKQIETEKKPEHDLKKIRKVTEMKMDRSLAREQAGKKRNKPSKKRDKILMYSDEIKMLRDKGFSFRLIAEFLKVNRRFSVNWTYIRQLWKQIEEWI